MGNQSEVLEQVIRYMVQNSVKGIYHGTPRTKMEDIDVSSGPLYNSLYELGIERKGTGRNAEWIIPQNIIKKYK